MKTATPREILGEALESAYWHGELKNANGCLIPVLDKALKQLEEYYQNLYLGRLPEKLVDELSLLFEDGEFIGTRESVLNRMEQLMEKSIRHEIL